MSATGEDDGGEWQVAGKKPKQPHRTAATSRDIDSEIISHIVRISEYERLFQATTDEAKQKPLTAHQEALIVVSKLITGNEVCGAAYLNNNRLFLSNNTEEHRAIEGAFRPALVDLSRSGSTERMVDVAWSHGLNYHNQAITDTLQIALDRVFVKTPAINAYLSSCAESGKYSDASRAALVGAAAEINTIRKTGSGEAKALILAAYKDIGQDIEFLDRYLKIGRSELSEALIGDAITIQRGEKGVHAEMKMLTIARIPGGFIATPKRPCYTCDAYVQAVSLEGNITTAPSHQKTYKLALPREGISSVEKERVLASLEQKLEKFQRVERSVEEKIGRPLTRELLEEKRINPVRYGLFRLSGDDVEITRQAPTRPASERAMGAEHLVVTTSAAAEPTFVKPPQGAWATRQQTVASQPAALPAQRPSVSGEGSLSAAQQEAAQARYRGLRAGLESPPAPASSTVSQSNTRLQPKPERGPTSGGGHDRPG